jgi:hypothetical protein
MPASGAERTSNETALFVRFGREAQGAPPEGQECVPKSPFHGEREAGFTVLSRHSAKSAGSIGCALTSAIWGTRVTPSPSEYDGPLWLFRDPMRRWWRPAIGSMRSLATHSGGDDAICSRSIRNTDDDRGRSLRNIYLIGTEPIDLAGHIAGAGPRGEDVKAQRGRTTTPLPLLRHCSLQMRLSISAPQRANVSGHGRA